MDTKTNDIEILTKGRLHGIALALLPLLVVVSLSSMAAEADEIIQYEIDTGSSIIHTSGGIVGGGIGDLTIDGRFDIRLFESSSPLSTIFENVAVSTSPGSAFEFPNYVGFDSTPGNPTVSTQFGTQSNPLSLPSNEYTATLNRMTHQLTIVGTYYDPSIDGIVYDYTINTTIVPEPSTALLIALGMTGLAASRRLAA